MRKLFGSYRVAMETTLRSDINVGNTRDCQAAIEELSESLLELEESDVPANYVVRLRSEQGGLRKSLLRVYHIQREQFAGGTGSRGAR